MELNIQSIRDCDPAKLGREMGPHYVARRYAELSAAMIGLSESFPSDFVNSLLAELREEVGDTHDCLCYRRVHHTYLLKIL